MKWLKERATQHYNYAVRQAAVQELVRGWKDDLDTLRLLKERMQNDPAYWLREAAKRFADKIEASGKSDLSGASDLLPGNGNGRFRKWTTAFQTILRRSHQTQNLQPVNAAVRLARELAYLFEPQTV